MHIILRWCFIDRKHFFFQTGTLNLPSGVGPSVIAVNASTLYYFDDSHPTDSHIGMVHFDAETVEEPQRMRNASKVLVLRLFDRNAQKGFNQLDWDHCRSVAVSSRIDVQVRTDARRREPIVRSCVCRCRRGRKFVSAPMDSRSKMDSAAVSSDSVHVACLEQSSIARVSVDVPRSGLLFLWALDQHATDCLADWWQIDSPQYWMV